MPAPGGKHKGAESASTGYAGGDKDKEGKGGTSGSSSSSGSKSAGGKMGSGSSQSGGQKSSGGKMGSGSSQTGAKGSSTSGMGSKSANAATGPKGYGGDSSGTGLGSKMGAKSSQTGGVKSTGGGLLGSGGHTIGGGLMGPATSGGSFMGSKSMNSLAGLNKTDRSLVEAGSQLGSRFGMGTPAGIVAASEIAKTAYGELGPTWAKDKRNLEAIAQSVLNRMGVAATGKPGFGTTLGSILAGYDANAYGYGYGRAGALKKAGIGPLGTDAFKNAKFGTPGYNAGLSALGSVLNNQTSLPAAVADSSHYFSGKPPSWANSTFGKFGPHKFGYDTTMPSAHPSSIAASKAQLAAGNITSPLGMGRVPGIGGGLPSNVNAMASTFPGRPQPGQSFASQIAGRPSYAGAFPAEDRQPSTFPGRPTPDQSFNSMVAGRPTPSPGFQSAVAGRPQQEHGFNSMVAGRPEQVGTGFPAAFASDFPGRPGPSPGFASQVAGRPTPDQGFMSQIAGKPDFPGSLPGAPVTAEFPGRPGLPQDFNSVIAGRPAPAPTFNSQVASRMSPPGAFPAAELGYENPARSFANIPAPQVANIPDIQAPQQGGFLAGLGEAVKSAVTAPVEKAKQLAGTVYDNLNNPLLGLVREPGPNNPHVAGGEGRPLRGGEGGQMWTGREPPQAVAQMQQRVEEILRAYLSPQVA